MQFDYTGLVVKWIEIYGKELNFTADFIENAKMIAVVIGFKIARPQVIAQICLKKANPNLTFKELNSLTRINSKTYLKWMNILKDYKSSSLSQSKSSSDSSI